MRRFFRNFSQDEYGAVTVDFVVVTAAITILGAVIGLTIANGATDWANRTGQSLEDRPLGTDWVN